MTLDLRHKGVGTFNSLFACHSSLFSHETVKIFKALITTSTSHDIYFLLIRFGQFMVVFSLILPLSFLFVVLMQCFINLF